ncbi:MAG: alpha/beta hydrolase [Thioalkalispiraceae bacterium]|jgi:pimeloyl-ACP methyl ester carboxylesterase
MPANPTNNQKAIVFVHGIWMKGFEFLYLAYHLKKRGYRIYLFTYPSLFKTPEENADNLNRFVSRIKEPQIHWVAHSLGGIVLSHFFKKYPLAQQGKVVMIGTPINGSAVANYFARRKWLRWLLGRATEQGLLGNIPAWHASRQLCMIAGNRGIGIGMFLAKSVMQKMHDGTVNLSETTCESCQEYYVVPHGHFAMLWSKQVLHRITGFLSGHNNDFQKSKS